MQHLFAAHDNSGMGILLHCLDIPRNTYLIGAGVSAEQISVAGGLGNLIAKKWLSMGSYEASVPPHGILFSRLGLGSLFKHQDLKNELLWRVYDQSIKSILYMHFSKGQQSTIPNAYRIFGRLPSPITICNMNVDGIASRMKIPGITILNMHGTVGNNINWASRENSELSDDLVELGIELPAESRIWYPEPELPAITRTTPYKQAKLHIKQSKCLFILGYSFGSHGDTLDDLETFTFFCEIIRDFRMPVVVLNLNPEMLVDRIGSATGLQSIIGIAADWNKFANSIYAIPTEKRWPLLPLSRMSDELLAEYRKLMNQGS